MLLRPSEIFFSQRSISNKFKKDDDDSDEMLIGEVLDEMYHKRMCKRELPKITVCQIDGKWITNDNRRLWVFRCLEKLGKCKKIPVNKIDRIPGWKMTSKNGGESVKVRGDPGGKMYRLVPDDDDSSIDDRFCDQFNNMRMKAGKGKNKNKEG